jgi:hypothetical protein
VQTVFSAFHQHYCSVISKSSNIGKCSGGYLDLREKNYHETGEKCIDDELHNL